MWVIKQISEADFGCEERMPGEVLMALVTLADEYGRIQTLEVADDWLTARGLDEGDEWPMELVEAAREAEERTQRQTEWMNNFLDALEELER